VPGLREINRLSGIAIDSGIKVHAFLGPGLLESTYRVCLVHELRKRGLKVLCEVPLPVSYDGILIEAGYRLDILIEDQIVIEVKAVRSVSPVHAAQLLTYLRLSKRRVGLLMNFHVRLLKEGITRLINGF
jgi:GxxExxY protein